MKKLLSTILLSCASLSTTALIVVIFTLSWFTGPNGRADKVLDGEIGLRSYFYAGDGKHSDTAYEIVTYNHLANLSRLQNLGIFPNQTYFQVGHDFSDDISSTIIYKHYVNGVLEEFTPMANDYKVILGTDQEDVNGVKKSVIILGDYLDMSRFYATGNTFSPIGDEGSPFRGIFDGKGISIRNLKVSGSPEDIGVFGYVAHEGLVKGLVCEDLTIESLGYSKETIGTTDKPIQDFFSPEYNVNFLENNGPIISQKLNPEFINGINSEKFSFSKIDRYDLKTETYSEEIDDQTYDRDIIHNGILIKDINLPSRYTTNETNGYYYYGGYFTLENPLKNVFEPTGAETNVDGYEITYTWKSSSGIIKEIPTAALGIQDQVNAETDYVVGIDMKALADSFGEDSSFNVSGVSKEIDARLSLIASIRVNKLVYSRVIQSYDIIFYSNGASSFNDSTQHYDMRIYCDYVSGGTKYHHGNNIGLLVGHLDGSMSQCFVYNGKFVLNQGDGTFEKIPTESNTGLVGEIGKGVANNIDPEYKLNSNGDIGVINLTKIYESIRSDFEDNDVAYMGTYKSTSYIGYENKIVDGNSNPYISYLRYCYADNNKHYITKTVPPEGQNYDNKNYTLSGVNPTDDINSVDFLWNKVLEDKNNEQVFGVFKIISSFDPNATEENIDAYFTSYIGNTRILRGETKEEVYFSTAEWHRDPNGNDTDSFDPLLGATLPEYSDAKSFGYPFARDYNYLFKLNLRQMTKQNENDQDPPTENYMFNTRSKFLQNYLSSILVNKSGGSIKYGTHRFGFMFRDSENKPYTSFSSYMPIKKPKTTQPFNTANGIKYYPPDSIVFSIDNATVANVSVIGNGEDITIYSFDPNDGSTRTLTPYRTMKSKSTSAIDSKRYFDYDLISGRTESATAVEDVLADGNALYGHIFTLPKGTYCIGSDNANKAANIYFLSVQGQDNGTITAKDQTTIGSAITDVDFLTSRPGTVDTFPFKKDGVRANISFSCEFNVSEGEFFFDSVDEEYFNFHYNKIYYDDTLDYMVIQCNKSDQYYYINGAVIDNTEPNPYTFRAKGGTT